MSGETAQVSVASGSLAEKRDGGRKGAALFVLVFGLFLVWGATYANPINLHNAAHDSRHAFAFPCH